MSRDDDRPPEGGDWRDRHDENDWYEPGSEDGYGQDGYPEAEDDAYGPVRHEVAEEPRSRGPALLIGTLAAAALATTALVYVLVTQDSSDTDAGPTTPQPTVSQTPMPTESEPAEPSDEPTEDTTPTETAQSETVPTETVTETITETVTAEPTEEPTETGEPAQDPDSLALGVGTIGDIELPAAGADVLALAQDILGEPSDNPMDNEHLGLACLDLGMTNGDHTEFERSSWMQDEMRFMIEGPVVDGEWMVDFYDLSIATDAWDGQQWEGINLPHGLELGMSEEEVAETSPEAERIDYMDETRPFSAFLWEDGTIASLDEDGSVRSIWMKPKLCSMPER